MNKEKTMPRGRMISAIAVALLAVSSASAERCEGPHITIDFTENGIQVVDLPPDRFQAHESVIPGLRSSVLDDLRSSASPEISRGFISGTKTCDSRWITNKRPEQWIYTIRTCGVEVEDLQIDESLRRSRITDDFRMLVTLLAALKKVDTQPADLTSAAVWEARVLCQELRSSTLARKRGTLKVEGKVSPLLSPEETQDLARAFVEESPSLRIDAFRQKLLAELEDVTRKAKETEAEEDEESEEERLAITLLTGPTERLFLSADAPLSDLEEVTIDEEASSLVTRDAPAKALLGLNIALSDIHSGSRFNPALKLMLEASDEPGNTLGVGVGVPLSALGLEPFQVFGAYLWTNENDVEDGWVLGLSFDLSKLGSWLKAD